MSKSPDPSITKHPIIFFDGFCNLCNRSVQFVLKHDKEKRFLFSPLQSALARKLFSDKPYLIEAPASLMLLHDGKLYVESTAALKICRQFSGPWSWLYWLIFIPPVIRDFVYRIIANNRYKWFGKKEVCMIPEPGWKDRFLE